MNTWTLIYFDNISNLLFLVSAYSLSRNTWGTLLCYCLCWSLSGSPLCDFRLIPTIYADSPDFYSGLLLLRLSPCVVAHAVRKLGGGGVGGVGGGSYRWQRIIRVFAHELILGHNSMCQTKALFQIPVRLLVNQGNGESNSADHSWVLSCDRNCNPTVDPALHVQNEFVHFLFNESTQFCEYDQVFPT